MVVCCGTLQMESMINKYNQNLQRQKESEIQRRFQKMRQLMKKFKKYLKALHKVLEAD